jgi:hypothetical protein
MIGSSEQGGQLTKMLVLSRISIGRYASDWSVGKVAPSMLISTMALFLTCHRANDAHENPASMEAGFW